MTQIIEHSGIINKIYNNHFQVLIMQQTACSECQANEVCFTSESGQKIIEVECSDSGFNVGDKVILFGNQSIGLLAVLLAFVLPFMLLLITLIILSSFVTNEVISGALSVMVLIPYYVILSFFKTKLKTKLKFNIKKENNDGYESITTIR